VAKKVFLFHAETQRTQRISYESVLKERHFDNPRLQSGVTTALYNIPTPTGWYKATLVTPRWGEDIFWRDVPPTEVGGYRNTVPTGQRFQP